MSSIGLAVFRNKALQESAVNNAINISNNNDEVKTKDVVIVRKKQKVQTPQTVSVTSLLKATANSVRPTKRARSKDSSSENESVRNPAPLAVARRNARERNRVRQVNNGFAELRRHIPEEVAEAFENANCNRGPNKKLSKVETLRMAVEYIRNLESLLNLGPDKENTSHSFPSPASSTPGDQSMEHSLFSINSPTFDDDGYDEDELDSLPPIAPQHYARISSNDNFRLSTTPVMYEDDDTAEPLTPSSDLVAENQFSMDVNYQLLQANEQFCVIRNDSLTDSDVLQVPREEIELKYAEAVQLGNIPDGSILLSDINPLSSQIFIHHADFDSYSVVHKTGTSSLDGASFDESNDLKQEIPELDVTPEDRKQFEETLKWWQEKTQIQAPNVKSVI